MLKALLFSSFILTISCVASAASAADGDKLSGEQIRALFDGHAMTFTKVEGHFNGEMHWKSDWTFSGFIWIGPLKVRGEGKWSISREHYCRSGYHGERPGCFVVRRIGSNEYRFERDDGSLESVGTPID